MKLADTASTKTIGLRAYKYVLIMLVPDILM